MEQAYATDAGRSRSCARPCLSPFCGSTTVQAFKRIVGHMGAPSAFELSLVLCLLVMVGVGLTR